MGSVGIIIPIGMNALGPHLFNPSFKVKHFKLMPSRLVHTANLQDVSDMDVEEIKKFVE